MTAFESRLAGMFEEYAAHAPTELDTNDVFDVIRVATPRRTFVPLLGLGRRRWLTSVLLLALLVAALTASVLIGAMLLTRKLPPVRPLTIQPTGFMTQQRAGAAAVSLADGRVLIIGGSNGYVGANQFFAELYEPGTRTFRATGTTVPTSAAGGTATRI